MSAANRSVFAATRNTRSSALSRIRIVIDHPLTTLLPPFVSWTLILAGCAAFGNARADDAVTIQTDRGTWMNVDVSPDGKHLVFDHLGALYQLPIAGGRAIPLLNTAALGGSGHTAVSHSPAYSPDGVWITFVSDASGSENLWIVRASGEDARQLSFESGLSFNSPVWLADGSAILVRRSKNQRDGEIWRYATDAGSSAPLGVRGHFADVQGPEQHKNTLYLAVPSNRGGPRPLRRERWQIIRWSRDGEFAAVIKTPGGAVRPRVSPDGRWLAFASWSRNRPALVLSDLHSGDESVLLQEVSRNLQDMYISQMDLFPAYAFTPDSASLVISYGGELHRVAVPSGERTGIPFRIERTVSIRRRDVPEVTIPTNHIEARMLRWPAAADNGRSLVLEALGRLWMPDEKASAGDEWIAVTPEAVFALQPDLSDDGRIVFIAAEPGGAHNIVMLDTNRRLRRLTDGVEAYAAPRFCADLSCILAVKGPADQGISLPGSSRRRSLVQIDLETLAERPLAVGAISVAGAWPSPDGRSYLAMGDNGLIRLDAGSNETVVPRGRADLIVPSPDGRRVAIAINNHVLVSKLERADATIRALSSYPPPYSQYPGEFGFFPTWIDDERLLWSTPAGLRLGRADALDEASSITARIRHKLPAPARPLLFSGGRAITMTPAMSGLGVIENADVVIVEGRFSCVAAKGQCEVPDGARRIDASYNTLIPGLIDVHQHALALMGYSGLRNIPGAYPPAELLLAYGVTATRDPALLSNSRDFGLIEAINAGRVPGPRYYGSGERIMPEMVRIEGPGDAHAAVGHLRQMGATSIKEYLLPDRRQRVWLREAAQHAGIAAAFEGGFDYKLSLTAILDGYTSIEHSAGNHRVHEDVFKLLRVAGAYYSPTILTQIGADRFFREYDIGSEERLRRFLGDRAIQLLMHRPRRGQGIALAETAYATLVENAAAAGAVGVPVVVGAHDAPAPTGLGTHWEMWALAEGGMAEIEVLRAATIRGAEAIGIDHETGSIEAGKRADLLVLRSNPLEDIRHTTDIDSVVLDGHRYDGVTLKQLN